MQNNNKVQQSGEKTPLPPDLKEKVERMIAPAELRKALDGLDTMPQAKDRLPDISTAASSTECTGLMYAMPKDEEEYASYQELYSMEIPKESRANAYDGGEHSARGRKNLHGKETPSQ